MPVQARADEWRLVQAGLVNYWGYNTLAFFAPDHRFATDRSPVRAVDEFKTMVRALHAAGLEVILDVVYNHTAEGDETGPTLSFRGIDNASYYRLDPHKPAALPELHRHGQHARHAVACRAAARHGQPALLGRRHARGRFPVRPRDRARAQVRRGRYAVPASARPVLAGSRALAREAHRRAVGRRSGRLSGRGISGGLVGMERRISEHHPAILARRAGAFGDLPTRLAGSSDLYRDRSAGRRPTASINFVTTHDGFTLADLVAYNEQHNEANGENNRDGERHNLSWNCGVEGETDFPAVLELRRTPPAQLPAHADGVARRADALRRRRDGPNAARQQQRLLPRLGADVDAVVTRRTTRKRFFDSFNRWPHCAGLSRSCAANAFSRAGRATAPTSCGSRRMVARCATPTGPIPRVRPSACSSMGRRFRSLTTRAARSRATRCWSC